jgi:hypothetical protein
MLATESPHGLRLAGFFFFWGKHMASVNADELENAVIMVSGRDFTTEAWVCRETGKIVVRADEMDAELEEVPGDVEDEEKYLPIPDERSLDLGQTLVFNFVEAELPNEYDRVRQMFRRPGAYRQFHKLVDDRDLRERWHAFRDEQTRAALKEWCEENGLQLDG